MPPRHLSGFFGVLRLRLAAGAPALHIPEAHKRSVSNALSQFRSSFEGTGGELFVFDRCVGIHHALEFCRIRLNLRDIAWLNGVVIPGFQILRGYLWDGVVWCYVRSLIGV